MKTIIDRLTSETPEFWKKVRTVAITLLGIAGAIITIDQTTDLELPAKLVTISQYAVAFAAAMGISAQATKKDNQPPVAPAN